MTYRTLNSAWKKSWPDSVARPDFQGFEPDDSSIFVEVVSMGKSIGPEVKCKDVHELLKSHEIELHTEELQHMQKDEQKTLADEMSSDEDEVRESVQSSLIKEMCAKLGEVLLFEDRYLPDTMLANMSRHIFYDIPVMHFRKILKRRRRQLTVDKLLAKKARKAIAAEEQSTASRRQRREITPKGELPSLFMEVDSPS